MYSRQQEQIDHFLTTHQAAFLRMVEEAYSSAGGHYARMTPEEWHRQARQDTAEILESLRTGVVSGDDLAASLASMKSLAIIGDVLHMSEALDPRLVAYIEQQAAAQPELQRELVYRVNNASGRFRMNLATAYMKLVKEAGPPAPSAPGHPPSST